MNELILAGLVSLGFILIFFKIGIRKVLAYDLWVDISITVLMIVLGAGTATGTILALLTGLIISITLLTLRKVLGTEKQEWLQQEDGRYVETIVRTKGWLG